MPAKACQIALMGVASIIGMQTEVRIPRNEVASRSGEIGLARPASVSLDVRHLLNGADAHRLSMPGDCSVGKPVSKSKGDLRPQAAPS